MPSRDKLYVLLTLPEQRRAQPVLQYRAGDQFASLVGRPKFRA